MHRRQVQACLPACPGAVREQGSNPSRAQQLGISEVGKSAKNNGLISSLILQNDLHSECLDLGMVRGPVNLEDIFHPRIWRDTIIPFLNILSRGIVKRTKFYKQKNVKD